jgi:hypothetical protein
MAVTGLSENTPGKAGYKKFRKTRLLRTNLIHSIPKYSFAGKVS